MRGVYGARGTVLVAAGGVGAATAWITWLVALSHERAYQEEVLFGSGDRSALATTRISSRSPRSSWLRV